jgi:P4 family phage/plasmid primase-like protien
VTLLHTATTYLTAGLAPLPIRPDGSKAPAVKWTDYRDQPPSTVDLERWFGGGVDTDGIGTVTGAASGHLEMIELEGRAITEGLLDQLTTHLTDNGAAHLWQRINSGWVEMTPGSGMHWHYRISDGPARPNTKLARRPATPAELADNPKEKVKVLIETRGQGGFTVLAPSAGRTHPTGAGWVTITGSPATCPTITSEERDLLYAVASILDRTPEPEYVPNNPGSAIKSGTRPGDDYNTRATWDDILTGWTKQPRAGFTAWKRPGKDTPGISATTGRNDADNLYVFSSSTEFDTERPYSKFAAYTLLEHAGDYSKAAKALNGQGYGTEPTRETTNLASLIAPTIHGNLATVTSIESKKQEAPVVAVTEHSLTRSDDGNALALIDRFGHLIRYCTDRGRWIVWDEHRWQWCERGGGVVREYAKRIARSLPQADQTELNHKRRSLGAAGTSAMVMQAATDARIAVQLGNLDAHPHDLNTPTGIVNLHTGHLRPPDPARLHTRLTAVSPDTDQPTPRWQAFLDDTFEQHPDVAPFLQRLAGYSATGAVTHHVLPFLHGPGGNGKSVFLDVLRSVLGDYAGSAPAKFLMATREQHETEIARLSGLRLVICSEVNQEDRFDEAKVKLLTGGDALTARFMQQDHFTFIPTHHLWLMGNHQPKVSGGGESFWRRLRMVPFTNTVTAEKKIDDLASKLISEEGPGILAWVIRGAIDVLNGGLRAPESVMAATTLYADEEDALARFVADRVHLGGGQHVRIDTAEMRKAYTGWCRDEGENELTPQMFGREIRSRFGVGQARSHGRRFYVGCALLTVTDTGDRSDEAESRDQAWWDR